MELNEYINYLLQHGYSRPDAEKLIRFEEAIHIENGKFNLTGHKSIPDIREKLIRLSIAPLSGLDVPRGTMAADMGTGAGIPGIPLALLYPGTEWVLFDSSGKKISFLKRFCTEEKIFNAVPVYSRVEDAGREDCYREKFDFVFTRALAGLFVIAELGSPLLKRNGTLIAYKPADDNPGWMLHAAELGLSPVKTDEIQICSREDVTILKKTGNCGPKYPRRYAVIKRDSQTKS